MKPVLTSASAIFFFVSAAAAAAASLPAPAVEDVQVVQAVQDAEAPLNIPDNSNAPIIIESGPPLGGSIIGLLGAPVGPRETAATTPPLAPKTVYYAGPGPWGNLEYYLTCVQIPQSMLDDYNALNSRITIWHFPGHTVLQAVNRLIALGFDAQSLLWTQDFPSGHLSTGTGIRLFPPNDFIVGISPDRRAALAAFLRAYPENKTYFDPVVIESGDVWSWYREAGLSESTIDLISRVAYSMRGTTVMSDWPFVLSMIPDKMEQHRFRRALTRTRTLVLRLNLADVDRLEESKAYWSAGYKRKEILPIMESVFETPGVDRLDVAHLLPPTPRKLLYTFPSVRMTAAGLFPDCYWTAANFFNEEPAEEFLQTSNFVADLNENWESAAAPFQFGDLILIVDSNTRQPSHAATYIADDIFFTKNGKLLSSPWIFMRYGDLMTRYNHQTEIEIRAFRRKK